MRSLKVINDRNTLCMPPTHQSMITRLAMMTRVCFLPSPLLSFFLNIVISSRLLPPVFLSLSFPLTSQSPFQSRLTSWGGVRQPLPPFVHFYSVSLQKMLSLSNFSSDHIVSRRDSSLLSHSFSLPKSSHVQRVTGQMCHTTVDEQQSVS